MAGDDVRFINTVGAIVLTVPPLLRVPGGDVVPCSATMFAPRDATTGELLYGVLVVDVHADANFPDVYADLTRIKKADGSPAETAAEVMEVAKLWGLKHLPRIVQRFTVNGFEIGRDVPPTFEPTLLFDDDA